LSSCLRCFSSSFGPVSHSVRLFANMLAGHITLKVFAAFVTMLGGLGIVGWVGATLPLALTVAVTALELLVGFCRLMCSPSSPASISMMRFNPAATDGLFLPTYEKGASSWIQWPPSISAPGIACIGMGGAGVGVGTIFGNYLAAALRNPSAASGPVRQPESSASPSPRRLASSRC